MPKSKAAQAVPPGVGDAAPDFDLPDGTGRRVSLRALRGRPVVLYFYPKDDTPGCTREACAFRDGYAEFQKLGAEILGVSLDSPGAHEKFTRKYALPFPLLSDEDSRVCRAYGVYGRKLTFGVKYLGIERSTFVIDRGGRVAAAFRKVKVDGHDHQVLEALSRLPRS